MTTTSSTASEMAQSPIGWFLTGMLIPSLAFFFLGRRKSINNADDIELDGEWDDEDDDDVDPVQLINCRSSASWSIKDAPYKMVLCINQELGMGKGKIAAQCGHAAVGCYKRASKICPGGLSAWERTGCAKIAVKCPSEEEMNNISRKAAEKGIPMYLVEDAGRTQIAAGSRTVLGLGPAPVREFEGVTSHLKLM
mmetsp:Transcript_20959/g.44041  ORF Transcript_20959/g.44041 Transcript_20959/m.44041 type:complete len:195 (+) Transcript_20959:75-659(+)